MYHRPNKRAMLIRQSIVYFLMTIAVFAITTIIIYFVNGFRLNLSDGKIEQFGMLQFASQPSGADVYVDGQDIGSNTSTKLSVSPGEHDVVIKKEGYLDWKKTVNVKAGIVTWLNYALLIPDETITESVYDNKTIYDSMASYDGKSIILQMASNTPQYVLVDISSDIIKTSPLEIPKTTFTDSKDVNQVFEFASWDDNGQNLIVKHTYDGKIEWIFIDVHDVARSKNLTTLFNLAFSKVEFAGSNGNILYVSESGNLRKADISKETISKNLASGVKDYKLFDSNTVLYLSDVKSGDISSQVLGMYRDGDESVHIIKTVESNVAVKFAITRYFKEDYIAYSVGSDLELIGGNYPNGDGNIDDSMRLIKNINRDGIADLEFSPSGQYLLIRYTGGYSSYDLEYDAQTNVIGAYENLTWIDDNHLSFSASGSMSVMDFDGANINKISTVVNNQTVVLTSNSKYIYSINKVGDNYRLERTKIIK